MNAILTGGPLGGQTAKLAFPVPLDGRLAIPYPRCLVPALTDCVGEQPLLNMLTYRHVHSFGDGDLNQVFEFVDQSKQLAA